MTRATIDLGIDLGTTNSAVALLKGTQVLVFKNSLGVEYTPSAVWIDGKNRLHVGQNAKDRLEDDAENAACEFKLLMGMEQEKVFRRSGKRMKPPDLSAWILRALRRDVQRQTGEDLRAAVVTIPAAFQAPQREATKKAAQLAGLVECPLLQEPVAAGLAYGFQSEKDNVYWLVYDLGGGTFDAAVIQVRGGEIHVIGHEGDNHLGGKKFDWDIVEKLFLPALLKEHPRLHAFHRANPRWRAAFAKLKWWAEDAKIKLSAARTVKVFIDTVCEDDRGQQVPFEFDLSRSELEKLIEPYILRTINISKTVLADARLGTQDVEKVLLVGGPTQTPFLRQWLIDSLDGLGIPLDFRVDPMTVVSRGAAIFAGTQRLPMSALQAPEPGAFALELDYKPVGADPEPFVGGKVLGAQDQNFSGFTIEFVKANAKAAWRSGKIELLPDGKFLSSLWAEKGATNTFLIEVCDATGTKAATVPDRLTYIIGKVFTEPPLTHSLGIAMANNEVDIVYPKGTPLPAKGKRCIHHTVHAVEQDHEGNWLTIPIVEGNNTRADRNNHIGSLVIAGRHIKRDIPAGSEVEIRVEVDTDHLIKVRAYLPILDQEFPATISYKDYHKRSQDSDQLRQDIAREKQRLQEVRRKIRETADPKAEEVLHQIEAERMEQQVDDLFAASRGDPEAAAACHNRLLDLRSAVDDVEDALEWPTLVAQTKDALQSLRKVVDQFGKTYRQRADTLEQETTDVLAKRDPNMLRRKTEEVERLKVEILQEQPAFWVMILEEMEKRKGSMRDRSRAEQLLVLGRQAKNDGNVTGLKAAVGQLISLLPADQQRQVTAFGASTQR